MGLLLGIGFIAGSIMTHEGTLIFIGVMFLAIFCGVGGLLAWLGISAERRAEKIVESGTAYMGKIYDYVEDHEYIVNGQPTLSVIVRYMKDGVVKQAVARTGQPDTAQYPRGATVSISILNGEAAIIPGSVSNAVIPDEALLMDRDIDAEKLSTSIGAACPNCGATLMVPVGMSTVCPYCGRKIKAAEDGSVI